MLMSNRARIQATQINEQQRNTWLARAKTEIDKALQAEPSTDPTNLAARLDRLIEVTHRSVHIYPQDKSDLTRTITQTKLTLYTRYIDHLLERAHTAARAKDQLQTRNQLLRRVQEFFTLATKCGASDTVRAQIKERLDLIKQTSPAGESERAKTDAEKEAARLAPTAHPNEQRLFSRWVSPSLRVEINGTVHHTLDWSLGGMRIALETDQDFKRGEILDVRIGIDDDNLRAERIEVVRFVPEQRHLMVRNRRFAGSALMQIKRELETLGTPPTT